MKQCFCIALALSLAACSGKPSLNSEEKAYVRTTLDLLHTRATFAPVEDSVSIQRSLDSVYRLDLTSAKRYQAETLALSKDPDRTAVIFDAINDSIGK